MFSYEAHIFSVSSYAVEDMLSAGTLPGKAHGQSSSPTVQWSVLRLDATGLTVGGGLEKLSQGRNFFFWIPARTQLSAYANHEFKIISTPTQLSAYANHELKN